MGNATAPEKQQPAPSQEEDDIMNWFRKASIFETVVWSRLILNRLQTLISWVIKTN